MNVKIIKLFILFLSIFITVSSFYKIRTDTCIWLEAEDSKSNSSLNEIQILEDPDASLQKGIIFLGRSHISFGKIIYEFMIPVSGDYHTWFRAYWTGGCSNSFMAAVDNSPLYIIGNDMLFDKWHWVKGPKYNLKQERPLILFVLLIKKNYLQIFYLSLRRIGVYLKMNSERIITFII
jgi:hypothetical protein